MKKMDDDLDEVATRTRFVLSPRRGCELLRFEQRPEGLTVLPDEGKAFGAITVDLSSASILRQCAAFCIDLGPFCCVLQRYGAHSPEYELTLESRV